MKRTFVNILLVLILSLPSWGRSIIKTAVTESEIDHHLYKVMLVCNTGTDTTYTITLWDDGRVYRSDDAMLLLKLGDGTVVPLHPSHKSCFQVTDSMYYNNEGEPIFIHRNEMLYDYPIDKDDLRSIMTQGIIKVRIGIFGTSSWAEKSWKHDEWGKKIAEAFSDIQKELAPDYVPPKSKTIYDDF